MRTSLLLAAAATISLAACDAQPDAATATAPSSARAPQPADDGYVAAPTLAGAGAVDGAVVLEGRAAPGANVRVSGAAAARLEAAADAEGRWRLSVPVAAEPRLLELSMTLEGRVVPAPGEVLLGPSGRAAVLRAGAGAVALAPARPPRITAFDFDREGAAIVSGFAPPGAALSVRIDGRQAATGRADDDGRFSLALAQPLAQGARRVELVGDAFRDSAIFDATPVEPPAGEAFRARATANGLRADWMTPGGGLQSTWVLE